MSLFFLKKVLRCRICQMALKTTIVIWNIDHQTTREFVLSDVSRKRASRAYKKHQLSVIKKYTTFSTKRQITQFVRNTSPIEGTF
jgi:GTP-sensing pleiotropic transcriptional regulator CodY